MSIPIKPHAFEKYTDYIIRLQSLNRNLSNQYTEKHHIIPRCLSGPNAPDNLIVLLPEEHFMAHKLLALEMPDNRQLALAYSMMAFMKSDNQRRYHCTPEEYALAKQKDSEAKKKQVVTEETRKKISDARRGHPVSEYQKQRCKETWIGRKHTLESKLKMSASHKLYKASAETRAKLSDALKGKIRSSETRIKMSKARTGDICLNNGTKTIRVKQDAVAYYISLGYTLGSISTKQGLIPINNGIECIQIYGNQLAEYEKLGYKRGWLRQTVKGRHWYTNGINEVLTSECPDGYKLGRLKGESNNGNSCNK